MEKKLLNILAIGRNAEIMQVMQRLINVPGKWTGTAVLTNEEAIATARKASFDLALLCAGINTEEENILKEALQQIDPAIIVIRHYGGGSGLLENEILAALAPQKA
ncbi:hypothetical protein D3H65_05290 [Paraflavitalea soli]|uniref:Response regulator receiver protein n=1 Tax=Paraflavitalea soli TaxID=2315862 RepID=A0A3B7MPC8_9BACT|nr:hypothetical protein [Paraflavitalea soli]AXY73425.1 hypothetical protein D3H65_05290 [Paraflavitalea soli]